MKYLYKVFFEKEKDGGYSVVFPAVPEAMTCGDKKLLKWLKSV